MKKPEITVTHGSLETYTLRSGYDWAVIALQPKSGLVMIASSYGTWSYIWNAPGERGLKQFLSDLDKDYLIGKLGAGEGRVLDLEETLKVIRTNVKQLEKRGELSEERLEEIEALLASMESEDASYFYLKALELSPDVYEHPTDIPTRRKYAPALEAFYDKFWGAFAKQVGVTPEAHLQMVDAALLDLGGGKP